MTASQPPEPPGGPSSGPVPGSPPPGASQPAAPPPPPSQPWAQQPPPPPGQPWGQQPPPGYGHQPPPGAPGYGQGYGQAPSWSAPPPQPGWGQQPPPGYGPPAYGHAAPGGGTSVDLKRLRMADWVVAGGTLLFLVLAILPWEDYGDDTFFGSFSLSGFQASGAVSSAFVLFLLAAAWALLPAFHDLRTSFPRAWVTVGLAGLGFLLTLVGWIGTLDVGFSIFALLGLLCAAAILLFALFTLLPQLRNRPALPGALAGAAQWANQPAPDPTAANRPSSPYGQGAPPPPPPASWTPPAPGTGTPSGATAVPPPPPPESPHGQ